MIQDLRKSMESHTEKIQEMFNPEELKNNKKRWTIWYLEWKIY